MPPPSPDPLANPNLSLATVRSLVRAYQAFAQYSETFVRQFGLTPAQFDVIATLGHTPGLAMGDLGAKTLITKGTLTGVVDRLVKKGLVSRETPADNRRTVVVRLTPGGQTLFEQSFPAHLTDLNAHLAALSPAEMEQLQNLLHRLQNTFSDHA